MKATVESKEDIEELVREFVLDDHPCVMAQSVIADDNVTIQSYGSMDNFCPNTLMKDHFGNYYIHYTALIPMPGTRQQIQTLLHQSLVIVCLALRSISLGCILILLAGQGLLLFR
mgnify:CR=1 FL=1